MSEDFKKKQHAICTSFPLYDYLKDNLKLYKELSRRSERDFGENLLSKYCVKREMCFDECRGRPIPAYPELEDFVKQYSDEVSVGEYKGNKVYLVYATLCSDCPIVASCQSLCGTMESFLEKDQSLSEPYENRTLEYRDYFQYDNSISSKSHPEKSKTDIPWNVLSLEQIEVVELRALCELSWKEVSQQMSKNEKTCQRLFQRSIKKLKRVSKAIQRDNLQSNEAVDMFIREGLSISEIAKKEGVSERAIYKRLARILNPSETQ